MSRFILNMVEIQLFLKLKEDPEYKFTGFDTPVMHTIASYGLLKYAGNFQYEFTPEGYEVLAEILSEETSEKIPEEVHSGL